MAGKGRGRLPPLLDESWHRVADFDEAGPSSRGATDGDAMSVDDDGHGPWAYEDEEEYVTLDLGPDSKRLVQMSQEYSITGLETRTPFMQLGHLTFKGAWDELIGTEILLQDQGDEDSAYSRRHGPRARRKARSLWPLPASATDRRLERAPSTLQRRIVMRQAEDMAAKEASLVPPEHVGPSGLQQQVPILHTLKTGYVTHKDWVWIRERGWMRKEDAILLQEGADGAPIAEQNEHGDRMATDQPDGAAEQAQPSERPEFIGNVATYSAAQADDRPEGEEEDEPEQEQEEGASDEEDDGPDEEQRRPTRRADSNLQEGQPGRKRLSEEEKIRYQLWRAMRRIEDKRSIRALQAQGGDIQEET